MCSESCHSRAPLRPTFRAPRGGRPTTGVMDTAQPPRSARLPDHWATEVENPLSRSDLAHTVKRTKCISTDGSTGVSRYSVRMLRSSVRPWALGLLVAVALPALPRTSDATVVRALSLREKAEVAPVIIRGAVERVEVSWRDPGFIQTLITVRVDEALKGGHEPGDRVIVYRGGGSIDGFTQTAPGLSTYEPGEELVLFLEPLGAQYVGIGIGIAKYAIEDRAGEKIVTHAPNVSGATFRDGAPPIIEHIRPMQPTALHAFLKTLRSYLRKIPTQVPPSPRKGVELKAAPKMPDFSRDNPR